MEKPSTLVNPCYHQNQNHIIDSQIKFRFFNPLTPELQLQGWHFVDYRNSLTIKRVNVIPMDSDMAKTSFEQICNSFLSEIVYTINAKQLILTQRKEALHPYY